MTDALASVETKLYCVLLSGKMHSGKTTTQEMLDSELGKLMESDTVNIEMGNFATAIKTYCACETFMPIGLFYSEERKNKYIAEVGMTACQYLQHICDTKRSQNPDMWLDRLCLSAWSGKDSPLLKTLILIVGDCQYPSEIELLRPGLAVRLNGNPAKIPVPDDVVTHVSETALDDFADFDLVLDTDTLSKDEVLAAILRALVAREPVLFEKLNNSHYVDALAFA